MGFRFSIEHANWLAHILQPSGATPRLPNPFEERETLRNFLNSFDRNFYPSRPSSIRLSDTLRGRPDYLGASDMRAEIAALRNYFADVPWVALLLPSGADADSDRLLTDANLLRDIVRTFPDEAGLVLQLEEPPREVIALADIFPAIKTAFRDYARWPGILLWNRNGDSIFLELSKNIQKIRERLDWTFRYLDEQLGSPNFANLQSRFDQAFRVNLQQSRRCHILHISDLHLGSQLARRRMPRVHAIIRSLVKELGDTDTIIPLVTGDLMDTPSDDNLADVRTFLDFLHGLGGEEPVVVIGNHDVRNDGWLSSQFQQAVNLPNSPAIWFDDEQIAVACFNSVNGGRLARGRIGPDEMTAVGNALDQYPDKSDFTLVAALHHHPLPVERPDWYRQQWYEKFLGNWFETTESLEDANVFLRWLETRKTSAVLHGHKHIPRFDSHKNMAVIGCGSSVGKVDTKDPSQTFISFNVVTIDRANRSLSCRLLAERIPGAGVEGGESHEMVLRSALQ